MVCTLLCYYSCMTETEHVHACVIFKKGVCYNFVVSYYDCQHISISIMCCQPVQLFQNGFSAYDIWHTFMTSYVTIVKPHFVNSDIHIKIKIPIYSGYLCIHFNKSSTCLLMVYI